MPALPTLHPKPSPPPVLNPALAISRDMALLHPALRTPVIELIHQLNLQGCPFRLFEGYRTPQRQAHLYAQGRTVPGKKVTEARPWDSYHQYGLAADLVLYIQDIGWSWDTSGHLGDMWHKLEELATNAGLETLSFERPHVQLGGYELSKFHAGSFPGAGDYSWGTNLYASIESWTGLPKAPSTKAKA